MNKCVDTPSTVILEGDKAAAHNGNVGEDWDTSVKQAFHVYLAFSSTV